MAQQSDPKGAPILPFAGLSVVECGDGIAAAFAAKLLALMGADVIKIEPLQGDTTRRRGPFIGQPDPEASGMFLYLNADKRGVTLDLTQPAERSRLEGLLAKADFLIHNFPPADRARMQMDSAAICAAHPQLILAAISAFGDRGPHADYRAYDLTIANASGLATTGPAASPFPELPPLNFFGHQADFQSAVHALFVALAAYFHRLRTGSGQAIEVSGQECLAAMLEAALIRFAYTGGVSSRLGHHAYGPRGILPCADGWIFFNLAEERQWQTIVEMMGSPEWAADDLFKDRYLRGRNFDALAALLSEWTRTQKTRELYLAAQERRVPLSPINNAADVYNEIQLRAREFFASLPNRMARPLEVPTVPFKSTAIGFRLDQPAPRLGEHNQTVFSESQPAPAPARPQPAPAPAAHGPLAGLRVLDFSWVWAGPFCTLQLAHLGAEVIRIESRKRLCVMRCLPPYAEGKAGPNRSGLFNQNNQGKRSITLDFSKPEATQVVYDLARHCDLAVENFAPGVIDRMGFGYETLRRYRPDLIMISMSGYGRTGPQARFVNYGPQLAAQSGLVSVTGYEGDEPREGAVAYSDPASGIFAAFLLNVGLVHRARTGHGQYFDMSMLEVLEMYLPEMLLEYAMNGRNPDHIGNHDPLYSPYNCYKAQGDAEKWVTIAVGSESEWRALCQAMELPRLAAEPRFSSAARRKQNEAELDRIITQWTSSRDRWAATELLQKAGVAAFPTMSSKDLFEDPHLRERGFLFQTEHPETGRRTMAGIPWTMSATPCQVRKPAPLLGADTDEVLGDLLGYSRDKIQQLRAAEALE